MVAEVVFKSVPPLLTPIIGRGQPGIEPLEQIPILGAQTHSGPAGARCRGLGLLSAHGWGVRHEVLSMQTIAQTHSVFAQHHSERSAAMHRDASPPSFSPLTTIH